MSNYDRPPPRNGYPPPRTNAPKSGTDTLVSPSYLHLVELLSEGEVEGVVNDGTDASAMAKSIYLDGTPVRNSDGTWNYKGVAWAAAVGTNAQSYVEGFSDAESETAVGTQVTNGTPIIHTISDATVNAVVVTVEIPQLYQIDVNGQNGNDPTGDMIPYSVQIAIDVQSNGGGYVTQTLPGGTDTFTGICTKAYDRQFRIALTGSAPWDIRVRRVSADDSNPQNYQSQTWWKSYTTIVDQKLRYPNSALVALEIPAEIFGGRIPQRSYLMRGRKVSIPTNYDPINRTYSGTWDGTFKTAWTNNPAWCFYDLLTNSRYGLGQFLDAAAVDKWGLYTIAQYCDAYVATGLKKRATISSAPTSVTADATNGKYVRNDAGSFLTDGFAVGDEVGVTGFATATNKGRAVLTKVTATELYVDTWQKTLTAESAVAGVTIATQDPTELRFACNLYLQSAEDAYRVVRDLASIFRAMPYWSAGAVQVTQDAPADPEYLFTSSNVVDGLFTYSSSGKRARHTVAVVSWNDPNNHYVATKEYVTDEAGIALYGYNAVDVAALGCTSQGQAQRLGRWLLYTERLETETVSFKTGLEGALRSPGAVIKVQDQFKAGKRFGGRIVSATSTTATLDADITFEAGKTYTLSVILPDGTVQDTNIQHNGAVTQRTVTVFTAFTTVPNADAVYIITANDLSPVLYRVISVTEEEDGLYTIVALKHDTTKYAAVEGDTVIQQPPTTLIPSSLAPTNLVVSEALYRSSADIKVRMNASWDQNVAAQHYAVRWRRDGGNWSNEELVSQHFWQLLDITPGVYWVEVQAICGGVRTDAAQASYQVLGKTAAPADVANLTATVNALSVNIAWSGVADLDIDHYEVRSGGTAWGTGDTLLTEIAATSFNWTTATTGTYTFRVKAVDTSGNYSVNAASVTFTLNNTIAAGNIPDGTIASKKLLQPPSDNLVPNGFSEAGGAAIGLDPEGSGLTNDPINAYEGNWCRSFTLDGSGTSFDFYPTLFIPCVAGEQFFASCWVKASAALTGSGALFIYYFDKNQTFLGRSNSTGIAVTTAYQQYKLSLASPSNALPSGTCFIRLIWEQTNPAADAGKSVYLDALILRKMVTFDLVSANTLQTSNYAESGGNPTAGAKLDNVGTALKVAAGNLQVGQYFLSDVFFRSLNALDGDSALGQVFYKGSIDKSTRGGAPNIDAVNIQLASSEPSPSGSTALSYQCYRMFLTPSSLSDNLEALLFAEVQFWQYVTGQAASNSLIKTVALPFSRGFGSFSEISPCFDYLINNSTGYVGQARNYTVDLLVKVGNIYGWSDQRWFHAPSALYTNMTRDTTPPSGGSSAGTGGGSGGGGSCPEASELVLLADGTQVRACDLRPGAWVLTQHERTLEVGRFMVERADLIPVEKLLRVWLRDGRSLLDSDGHRFYVKGRGWTKNGELRPGDELEGAIPGVVERVGDVGPGHVVHLSVDGAQTFMQRGILSHNLKPL